MRIRTVALTVLPSMGLLSALLVLSAISQDNFELKRQREELLEQIEELQLSPEPAEAAKKLSDEEQLALVFAAIEKDKHVDDIGELREELAMTRRRVERADSATARERKARRQSCDERDKLLKINRFLQSRCGELEQSCARLGRQLSDMQDARRRNTSSRF